MTTIGVAVITHNAKHHLPKCLPPLLNSSLKPRVLVVNSSSQDGTVELAEQMGAETLVIPRSEFNHGITRDLARKKLGTDIVVMVTPDAYAIDKYTLEKLVRPIIQGEASIAYGRQIPHDGANFLEAYGRIFNYPLQSHVRSFQDIQRYGVYTIFCSNSFAAYSQKALDEIGGFPAVLLGEDTFTVAKLLAKGHKIAYVASAVVKHSHSYSLAQEFKRNFDTGLARKKHSHLVDGYGRDSKRGREFVRSMFRRIVKEKPYMLPRAFVKLFSCWLGYKAGRLSVGAPLWWKKMLSSQDFYWSSKYVE